MYFNIVEIPKVRTTTYDKNSFKYTAAILWNDLMIFEKLTMFLRSYLPYLNSVIIVVIGIPHLLPQLD